MTLALALDVGDARAARKLANDLRQHFDPPLDLVKVGLELFTAEGPPVVEALLADGFGVFLDLKLHDIPNTVYGAARSAGALGVSMLTAHAAGGVDMLRAANDGLAQGCGGAVEPVLVAVTVLTSDPPGDSELLVQRLGAATAAACRGIVCGAADLHTVKSVAVVSGSPDVLAVVPGIRLPDAAAHDQRNVATPAAAIARGADVLVIGRAVTAAADPPAAAAAISAEARAARQARSSAQQPHLP